jgi:transitional endoplasmic reticulum ATPase
MDELAGAHHCVNVVVLAATNSPQVIDPSILQGGMFGTGCMASTTPRSNQCATTRVAGRFDQLILVPPPDQASRTDILQMYISRLLTSGTIPIDQLAMRTVGFTGADLRNLCQRAGQIALRNCTPDASHATIVAEHLWAAVNATIPSAPASVMETYNQWAHAVLR